MLKLYILLFNLVDFMIVVVDGGKVVYVYEIFCKQTLLFDFSKVITKKFLGCCSRSSSKI